MTPTRGGPAAFAAMAALALVWGETWVVIKVATRDASPLAVAALRVGIGATVLFAVLLVTRRALRPPPFAPTLVLGLLQTTGFTLLQTLAVTVGGAGKSVVLAYTMPFWVALIAWPLLGERIEGPRRLALALAAAGLVCVLWPLDLAHGGLGDALAVLAGLSWAGSAVAAKRLRARYETELLNLTTWQMFYGGLPIVVLALLRPEHVTIGAASIGAIAFLGIVAQAAAWLIWMFVLSRLSAGVAGIASLATPVVGVVAAALQLREIPSTGEVAGIALITAALATNAFGTTPAPRRAVSEPSSGA